MKISVFGIAVLFLVAEGMAQVELNFNVQSKDTIQIEYLNPFLGFSNSHINASKIKIAHSSVKANFRLSQPTFVKIKIQDKVWDILCDVNDTITFEIQSPSKGSKWIDIRGKNQRAIIYYNSVYNEPRSSKFNSVTKVFEDNLQEEISKLTRKLINEINRQIAWIDSLQLRKEITNSHSEYLKTEIRSILAWHVGELYNQHFYWGQIEEKRHKGMDLMMGIFSIINPLDLKLRTCFASESYYYTYFDVLFRKNRDIDSVLMISKDYPFYAKAPHDMQWFLWGNALYANLMYNPDNEKNCGEVSKYINEFKESPFTSYFETLDVCSKLRNGARTQTNFIDPVDADLFSFVASNFPRKRVLIDLWATWCGPCIIEFKKLDESYYKMLDEKRVSQVFISVDDLSNQENWKKRAAGFNLKGYSLIARRKLRESIIDVVFDGKNVTIPRYVLFNERGELISIDFERPSSDLFRSKMQDIFK